MGEKKKHPSTKPSREVLAGTDSQKVGEGDRDYLMQVLSLLFVFGLSSVLLIVVCEKYKQALEEDILLFALLFLLVLYD